MRNPLIFLKNLLQIVLRPRCGWEDLAAAPMTVATALRNGFYPLLAVTAVTAFLHALYRPDSFQLAQTLQTAMVQFLPLFLSYFVARAAFENFMPRICINYAERLPDAEIMSIFCLSYIAIIQIVSNLCPMHLVVMKLLNVFILPMAWQARFFLDIDKDKYGMYLLVCVVVLLVFPLAIQYILGLLIY